jgi:hypothetical protein
MNTPIATPSAAHATSDLWSLYPGVPLDDIDRAIWIDAALKDINRQWLAKPPSAPLSIPMTNGPTVHTIAGFFSTYHKFLQRDNAHPGRLLLSLRRDAQETSLCFSWAEGAGALSPLGGATSNTADKVDAIALQVPTLVAPSDVPPRSTASDDIHDVGAVIKSVLNDLAVVWVNRPDRVGKHSYTVWMPTGWHRREARHDIAMAICRHVDTLIESSSSADRHHRVSMYAHVVADGEYIELIYSVSPIDTGVVVAAPTQAESTGSVPEAEIAPSTVPAPISVPTEGQSVAQIVALYPRLSARQVASVLMIESTLGNVPHYWTNTDVVGRLVVGRTLVGQPNDMIEDIGSLCQERAQGQRVALCVHESTLSMLTLSVVVPRPPSSPKTQTADDLLELYPTATAREILDLVKVIKGLEGIPTEWVDGGSGHVYDNNGLFTGAQEVIDRVRGAFAKINAPDAPCHVVLSLCREAGVGGKFVYRFIVTPTI